MIISTTFPKKKKNKQKLITKRWNRCGCDCPIGDNFLGDFCGVVNDLGMIALRTILSNPCTRNTSYVSSEDAFSNIYKCL